LKYRTEIDGLRALAVVPVIFFHAGFELFSGGFVGVDVFFVISGYLITTILIEDIENKRFSLFNFYERRARRILPALFFVMLVCIPFAWMWMLPDPLENFGQSLVAATLSANNVLLYLTSGYWDLNSEFKPLLHTWSLGVEEQYYALLPLLLLLTWQFGKGIVLLSIIIIAGISMALSAWISRENPEAAFFLIHTRAWELLAGSIAAFVVQKRGVQKNNLLAILGLSAILFSIFFYNETIPFLSVYGLAPVLGALLLVLYAEKETLVAKLLNTKAFIGIGLISYSAYLWHQPLISFVKIYSQNQPTIYGLLSMIFLTVCFSYLTWKFIEQPFRKKSAVAPPLFFFLSLALAFGFVAIGVYFHASNGVPTRIFNYDSYKRSTHEIKVAQITGTDYFGLLEASERRVDVLVYGDSFAADVAYLAKYNYPSVELGLIRSDPQPQNEICRNDLLLEAESLGVKKVVFAYDEGFNISCVNQLLINAKNKDISVLFIGTKQFGVNLNWLARLNAQKRYSLCQPPASEKIEVDIRDERRIPKENYFSFFGTFSKDNCFPITNSRGELLSSDRQHFTIAGIEYFSVRFFKNENVNRIFSPLH
jgi:peptidoglycan/LPS O-acetylase OafA/YrhL